MRTHGLVAILLVLTLGALPAEGKKKNCRRLCKGSIAACVVDNACNELAKRRDKRRCKRTCKTDTLNACRADTDATRCIPPPVTTTTTAVTTTTMVTTTTVTTSTTTTLPRRSDKSGPIDITPDGRKVVAANTDTDTVSFFEVDANGLLSKVQEMAVGRRAALGGDAAEQAAGRTSPTP